MNERDTKIWNIQYNDPLLKGANTKTWSNTDATTVFQNPEPLNLLSSKTNVFTTHIFNDSAATVPHQYNVQLLSQTQKDHLTGVWSETINTYDGAVDEPNAFGLKTNETTNTYYNTHLQAISTVDTSYDNNPAGVGNQYYIGRPTKVKTRKTVYPNNPDLIDTRTTGQIYSYTGFDLTHIEKTGHNTVAIHEDMTHDAVGNLLTKTVSVPNPTFGTPAVAARTIVDEYDPSKRFVIQKTDHQGFVTTFEYNDLGQVRKSINYMGVINEIGYDHWGKQTKTITNGAAVAEIITNVAYQKLADGGYTTTNSSNVDDNISTTQYDVLGRVVKSTTKGFAPGSYISKNIEYDALGHKYRESEPYFNTTTPSRWTTYTYDYLHRPIQVVAPTGRIQYLHYDGLTTTSVDDGKLTTATLDAIGNKVQTTDPGGTINFTYYANAQLKKSDYGGHQINIDIDGWGNKIALNDPNAGTYTYAFDDFGQSIHETTPKGQTFLEYDDFGKLTKKTLIGDGTDVISDYKYNTLAQLESETSNSSTGNYIDTFSYQYDTYHRLIITDEKNQHFYHSKNINYDDYARILTETNMTKHNQSGLTSTKTTMNHYNAYNGMMDKLTTENPEELLWKLNTANAKMQTLTAQLGNEIAIKNNYDTNGYFAQQKHIKNTDNTLIVNNAYNFNGVKGTLTNRLNRVLNIDERFEFDNLDRLTTWKNVAESIWDCPFNNGLEEFEYYGDRVTTGSNLTNTGTYAGKLKVSARGLQAYAEKQILTASPVGKQINIKFDATEVLGNAPVNILIVETNGFDQTTHQLGAVTNGSFNLNHTVTTYSEVYLRYELGEVAPFSNGGSSTLTDADGNPILVAPRAVFYIDNLKVSGLNIQNQTYDERGRIDTNNIGTYNYTTDFPNGIYRKTSIHLSDEGMNHYNNNRPLQMVNYNMFKSPISINESNKGAMNFEYNSHQSRQWMNYGFDTTTTSFYKYKNYTEDGSTEILIDKKRQTTTIRSYIGGDAYNAVLYVDKKIDGNGTITEKKYYLHRDYLGSIIAITNDDGAAVERRHFDAWGNLTVYEVEGVLTDPILGEEDRLDRGYTSHEHLSEVELIHMNGRLYDPVIRQFLMPDNFVQQPENTQNYNRYAYVLNNPLLYTDPSGEEFISIGLAIAISVFVSTSTYMIGCLTTAQQFSLGGLVQTVVVAAVSAAVTFGIGSASSSLFTNFYSQAAFQAAAHGTFQGVMTEMNGGSFISGFASGALSSIASSAFSWDGNGATTEGLGWASSVRESTASMIAFGTVMGGAGAALTGGNFWQGAVTGLIVSGLNHAAHQMDSEDPPTKGTLKKFEPRNSDGLTQEQYDNLSTFEKMITTPPGINATSGGLELIGGPVKGVKYLAKMAKKPNFVSSAVKKVGDFWEYSVKLSGSKGSFTLYKRYLNAEGKTIKMFHDTYDKTYRFIHREIMNGQERMKIWYDGTRQWFSKWR